MRENYARSCNVLEKSFTRSSAKLLAAGADEYVRIID
jgi:hypothetical protein